MLEVYPGTTVTSLKTFINTSYQLDIYRERSESVGESMYRVKPGSGDVEFHRKVI